MERGEVNVTINSNYWIDRIRFGNWRCCIFGCKVDGFFFEKIQTKKEFQNNGRTGQRPN